MLKNVNHIHFSYYSSYALLFDCNYGGKGTASGGNSCLAPTNLCLNSTKPAFFVSHNVKNKAHRETVGFVLSMKWGNYLLFGHATVVGGRHAVGVVEKTVEGGAG